MAIWNHHRRVDVPACNRASRKVFRTPFLQGTGSARAPHLCHRRRPTASPGGSTHATPSLETTRDDRTRGGSPLWPIRRAVPHLPGPQKSPPSTVKNGGFTFPGLSVRTAQCVDRGSCRNSFRTLGTASRRSCVCTSHGCLRHGTTVPTRWAHSRTSSPCAHPNAKLIA